jgi:hypothetical protein
MITDTMPEPFREPCERCKKRMPVIAVVKKLN